MGWGGGGGGRNFGGLGDGGDDDHVLLCFSCPCLVNVRNFFHSPHLVIARRGGGRAGWPAGPLFHGAGSLQPAGAVCSRNKTQQDATKAASRRCRSRAGPHTDRWRANHGMAGRRAGWTIRGADGRRRHTIPWFILKPLGERTMARYGVGRTGSGRRRAGRGRGPGEPTMAWCEDGLDRLGVDAGGGCYRAGSE